MPLWIFDRGSKTPTEILDIPCELINKWLLGQSLICIQCKATISHKSSRMFCHPARVFSCEKLLSGLQFMGQENSDICRNPPIALCTGTPYQCMLVAMRMLVLAQPAVGESIVCDVGQY